MPLSNMFCSRCGDGFEENEKIVNSNGELWHPQCFVFVNFLFFLLQLMNYFNSFKEKKN